MTARIAAAVSGGAAPVDPTRRRHACADGAVFAATFEGERAIVEVLGRAPLVLARVPVESGFRYGDGRRSLRGLGEEASWQVGDDVPVSCTIASSALALRLAPGDHPLFDPATRADGDWSRLLLELMPAIRACLARSVSHLPRGGEGVALEPRQGRGAPPECRWRPRAMHRHGGWPCRGRGAATSR